MAGAVGSNLRYTIPKTDALPLADQFASDLFELVSQIVRLRVHKQVNNREIYLYSGTINEKKQAENIIYAFPIFLPSLHSSTN